VITAAVVFGLVLWRARKPLPAVVTVIACLWSYEAIWNATDIAVHRWGWGPEPYWLMLAAGWTGWAWREGWRPNVALLAAFCAGHALWVVSGFHYNYPGRALTASGDVWNVATKTLWLLAWGLGSLVRLEALDGVGVREGDAHVGPVAARLASPSSGTTRVSGRTPRPAPPLLRLPRQWGRR
jgi:hypothetical protein